MTTFQQQGFQQMAKLCDEVEVGDRNGELQFLHQLPSIDSLQDIGYSRGSVLGKQLPQQPSLRTVAPVFGRQLSADMQQRTTSSRCK